MTAVQLAYGKDFIDFEFSSDQFSLLSEPDRETSSLTDARIGAALDTPIGSASLEDIVEPTDTVLIVVSDATRATGSAQVVNLLVRRVLQYGVAPADIAVIFATGIHRAVSAHERDELVTPFITQRLRCLDHDANNEAQLISLGQTRQGTPAEVSKALRDFSKVIITGGIAFHYFAGFTGGRKSICPGLASAETIRRTHMLALDFERGCRREGVGPGLLDGNAVNEECEAIAQLVAPAFAINAIVAENQQVQKLFCGDWRASHRAACTDYLMSHSHAIDEKRDVVVVSCGGSPYDINMIQAHKALEMASYACNEQGTIVLVAECPDGLGRPDFLKWFEEPNSGALASRLREAYEVNGQTAWSLMTKTERFNVHLVSSLPYEIVSKMGMKPVTSIDQALRGIGNSSRGYIFTRGASSLPRLNSN